MRLIDLIYPKRCLGCRQPGGYLCSDCTVDLGYSRWVTPKIMAVFPYRGIIKKALIALKYRYVSDLTQELSGAVARRLIGKNWFPWSNPVLVPIPLHPKKERVRGFNQAAEVGQLVARAMKWNYYSNLLQRKLATPPQVGLKGQDRCQNVRGAFVVDPKYQVPKSTCLIVFDDVVTTGSTLKEAMKVMTKCGYKKVYGLAVAG